MKKTKTPKKAGTTTAPTSKKTRSVRTTKSATKHSTSHAAHAHHRGKQLNKKQAYYAVGLFLLGGIISIAVYNSYSTPFDIQAPSDERSPSSVDQKLEQNSEDSEREASQASEILDGGNCKTGKDRLSRSLASEFAPEFNKMEKLSVSERIIFWSGFLERNRGARKKIAKFSRGVVDENSKPLVLERYDALRYVETVVALAQSNNGSEFVKNLTALRYKGGKVEAGQRNQFIDADWLPNNLSAGLISDITADVASTSNVEIKEEKKRTVRKKQANLADSSGEPIDVRIPYIALDQLSKVISNVPQGTIVNLVHRADSKHPGLVTHHGFIVHEGDQLLFRSASTKGQIKSNELLAYLQKLARGGRRNSRWALIGVNFAQVKPSNSANSCFNADT